MPNSREKSEAVAKQSSVCATAPVKTDRTHETIVFRGRRCGVPLWSLAYKTSKDPCSIEMLDAGKAEKRNIHKSIRFFFFTAAR